METRVDFIKTWTELEPALARKRIHLVYHFSIILYYSAVIAGGFVTLRQIRKGGKNFACSRIIDPFAFDLCTLGKVKQSR